jgi:hypothetical protein
VTSPLSTEQLQALYEQVTEDTKKKQQQLEKLNEYHNLKRKKGQSKGQSVSHNQSSDSELSMQSQGGLGEDRKFGHMRGDLTKIADKLRVAEDLETLVTLI